MMQNTAGIYCRLSVEDFREGESESIQNQKLLLLEYAKKNGFDVYQVYCDEDYSGLDSQRPAFRQLLQDAERGYFDTILCKTQSRFTRDAGMFEQYVHEIFVQWGIRFISVVDHMDTALAGNKKTRQITALLNEWYCEDLSENIKMTFRRKMEEGQFLGSFAAYGYRKDETDHHRLVIDTEAAAVVRKIFTFYLKGFGSTKIAHFLTEEGIATPAVYKRQKGYAFYCPQGTVTEGSGTWAAGTVQRILKNKVYIGTLAQGKERKPDYKSKQRIKVPEQEWVMVEHSHEPIIEETVFWEVQKRLRERYCSRQ